MTDKKWSTGGWKNSTAKGEVINFTINDVKYSMWKNAYKTEDKQPDYKIYINDFNPENKTYSKLKDDTEGLPF